jgi:DNA polymerase-3 subunit epsilon
VAVTADTAALLAGPLASTEFLAVDTETNGLARERCELTEVGAVLVGGGELHDTWSSLVGVSAPLSRGIQRFTGISDAMIAGAPPPEAVLPAFAERLRGRVLVAHNARFDVGVLRQAFGRAGLDWPDPPVLCTVALARRLAPLQKRRGLTSLADALGIDVGVHHRALPDAETCARIFCALFARLCAHAATVADAVALLGRRAGATAVGRPGAGGARARKARVKQAARPPERRPDLASLPQDPGVYVFRDGDGKALYVGKSVSLRTRARAHFAAPEGVAAWTAHAEHVDHRTTESELGALLLEDRLIKALKPPGNTRGKREPDGFVYLRCRLDIPFPILEVAREPAAGHAVCIGPVQGRAAMAELVEQLNSLFALRHCGRTLPRREWPSAYGQMGRCLSPCLQDLDPNLYRDRLDAALRLFVDGPDGGAALLAHIDRQTAEASAAQRYERAAWLQRRRGRLEALIRRLGGVLRATHAGARLVLAPHPTARTRFDAVWIAGGRVVDWGALPADREEVVRRSAAAVAGTPRRELGGWLAAGDVDEARIAGWWIAAHDPPSLELGRPTDAERIGRLLDAAHGGQLGPPVAAAAASA